MNISIRGMHCGSCKALIEDVCKDIPGVSACIVSFENGTAAVEHDGSVSFERVRGEIAALGDYQVEQIV